MRLANSAFQRAISGVSALALITAAPTPAFAQTEIHRDAIENICRAISQQGSSESAIEIVRLARENHRIVGGTRETEIPSRSSEEHVIVDEAPSFNSANLTGEEYGLSIGRSAMYQKVYAYFAYIGFADDIGLNYFAGNQSHVVSADSLYREVRATFSDPIQRARHTAMMQRVVAQNIAWSAAFVSAMIKRAGLDENAFRFHFNHSLYMQYAIQRTQIRVDAEAYYACDPTEYNARPGDILCFGREGGAPGSFEALLRRNEAGRPRFRSHCDIVVDVNYDGLRPNVVVIGGNISDTVCRRSISVAETNDTRNYAQATNCAGRDARDLSYPAVALLMLGRAPE